MCGRVVCSACSPEKADIAQLMGAGTGKKVERICKNCKKPVIVVTGGGVISSVKGIYPWVDRLCGIHVGACVHVHICVLVEFSAVHVHI